MSDSPSGAKPLGLWIYGAFALCLATLVFVAAADRNYRSAAGSLADTVPAFQAEILDGTAPAPYVYRQGIPRLRQLAGAALPPGHAALVVDLLLAWVSFAACARLARLGLGRDLAPLGMFLAALACAGVYPNDKPESVATVALVSLIAAFVLARAHRAAALTATLGALARPELPILLGLAMIAGAASLPVRLRPRIPILPYAAALIAGAGWMTLARLAVWPDATYPEGTPFFMLPTNLMVPVNAPGLGLGLLLASLGVIWHRSGRSGAWGGSAPAPECAAGLGLFVALYAVAAIVLGQAYEIRILLPLLPPLALLGARVWPFASRRSV